MPNSVSKSLRPCLAGFFLIGQIPTAQTVGLHKVILYLLCVCDVPPVRSCVRPDACVSTNVHDKMVRYMHIKTSDGQQTAKQRNIYKTGPLHYASDLLTCLNFESEDVLEYPVC